MARRHNYADDLAWYIERIDMPQPEREYRFAPPRRFRFDFCWVEERLALEVDGGRWLPGGGRHAGDDDYAKLNIAASLGWRVLRVTSNMVERDPLGVIDMVLDALAAARGELTNRAIERTMGADETGALA